MCNVSEWLCSSCFVLPFKVFNFCLMVGKEAISAAQITSKLINQGFLSFSLDQKYHEPGHG